MSQGDVETVPETDPGADPNFGPNGKPKKAGGGAAKPKGAKPPGGAKKTDGKPLRVQLHLSAEVVERLRVHTALVHRNDSAVVEEILYSYLAYKGKGRTLFPAPVKKAGQDLCERPDNGEDRQDEAAA